MCFLIYFVLFLVVLHFLSLLFLTLSLIPPFYSFFLFSHRQLSSPHLFPLLLLNFFLFCTYY